MTVKEKVIGAIEALSQEEEKIIQAICQILHHQEGKKNQFMYNKWSDKIYN